MSRRVKEFIQVDDLTSLDALIARLSEIRDNLPNAAEAELRMRGDDIFGRHLCISYMRAQTPEETACEGRYAEAVRLSRQRELERLQEELGFCPLPRLVDDRMRDAA
jgi:predicted ArsR family transcriptional regulator